MEAPLATAAPPSVEDRVLAIVRDLAREVGGHRAVAAVAPGASLERELGFGSLERVEMLGRLEREFARRLDERFLKLDSVRELSRALADGAATVEETPAGDVAITGRARRFDAARTIHESLELHAQSDPDRPHVFMREEDGSEHTITFARLRDAASAVAGGLRARGVERGDRVALMLPTGFDFLQAFQGILIAGAIPVPIYPPVRLDRLEEYAVRQGGILADAGVKAMVTIARARPIAALLRAKVPTLQHVVTASELAETGLTWPATEGAGSDAAFIQYTSGSTGTPKGVLLTHDNLLANVKAIGLGLEARPDDVGISWLPLYHDMGLIGTWLFCMHNGFPLDLMSPLAFLSRPDRWLWAVHKRRGTLSPAPNFAYELCARKVQDRDIEGLDLSSWRCALNGAEPIQPETLERFAKRFAPYGFKPTAMFPVYGLAENSVAVSFPKPGRGPLVLPVERAPFEQEKRVVPAPSGGDVLKFISVGRALPEHDVRVVDDEGVDTGPDRIGRVIFRGPSMTPGYFGKPDATAAIRTADGFLDSGDLGFFHDDELFIAGRRKDLVIKGGRNLVPHEIEEVASRVDGVRRGCVAAFGVPLPELGTEGLVVVAETRATDPARRAEIEAAVIQEVSAAVGMPPDVVHLVPPGAVPKTSSGKVRRASARELYLKGDFGGPGRARVPLGLLARAAWSEGLARLRPLAVVPRLAWLGLVTLVLLPPALLVAFVTPSGLPLRRLGRRLAALALRVAGLSWSREGAPLPDRPVVLVANHASYVDVPLLMAALERDFRFVSKHEVAGWPVIGTLLRRCEHLTVDRNDASKGVEAFGATVAALRSGASVLLFAEGTFTAASGLRPFRLGAFQAAIEAGVDVVPVALTGTRKALRSGSALVRRGHVGVRVGEPLKADGDDWAAVLRLRDRAAQEIAEHCGEPRLDLHAAGPERE